MEQNNNPQLEGYFLQLANIEGAVSRMEQEVNSIVVQINELRPLIIDMANFLGMKYPYPKKEKLTNWETTTEIEIPF